MVGDKICKNQAKQNEKIVRRITVEQRDIQMKLNLVYRIVNG